MESNVLIETSPKIKVIGLLIVSILLTILSIFVVGYILVAFTYIPVIKDARVIWIETAMTTGESQWLATKFFPPYIVKGVMKGQVKVVETVGGLNIEVAAKSKIEHNIGGNFTADLLGSEREYIAKRSDILGQKQLKVGELDSAGNTILVNDIEQGILISEVKSATYTGKLVQIDDPSRVFVAFTKNKGKEGQRLQEFLEEHDAVVGINGSGFADTGGVGNGGQVLGLSYSNGEAWGVSGTDFSTVAFDKEDRLLVGKIDDWSAYNIRDGVQFTPALIVNGEVITKGSSGWGVQPRTVVAQRQDGVVMFLLIDGRKPGYSIGATLGECADILIKYGAVTAGACDGGSSTVIAYNGEVINKPSGASEVGRKLPNAILVKKKELSF